MVKRISKIVLLAILPVNGKQAPYISSLLSHSTCLRFSNLRAAPPCLEIIVFALTKSPFFGRYCRGFQACIPVFPVLPPYPQWSNSRLTDLVWPIRCGVSRGNFRFKDPPLIARKSANERRKWSRLPLAIPVFVRSRDENGKELLEFANALNVSAGGALIALRRSIPLSSRVSLEIPSAPLGLSATLPKSSRNLPARALRVHYEDGYHLIGLKFSRALLDGRSRGANAYRKTASPK